MAAPASGAPVVAFDATDVAFDATSVTFVLGQPHSPQNPVRPSAERLTFVQEKIPVRYPLHPGQTF
jgi:hypothetical protein